MVFLIRSPKSRRGFTLVEVLVASALGVMVAGATSLLLVQAVKENRRAVAVTLAERASAQLEANIQSYLRVMSATEGVVFSSPVTSGSGVVNGYKNIVIARGPTPDYPREQITFDEANGRVLYRTNRTAGVQQVLFQSDATAALRLLYFSPTFKQDGTPDNSLINVLIRMDDNGSSGVAVSSPLNPATLCRTFTVRMRNR